MFFGDNFWKFQPAWTWEQTGACQYLLVEGRTSIWCCCCISLNNETCDQYSSLVQERLEVGWTLRIQTASPYWTQRKQFLANIPLVKVTLHHCHPAAPWFQQENQSQCGRIQLNSWNLSFKFPLRHRYVDSEDNELFIHIFNTVFTKDGLGSDCKSLNCYRRVWTKASK